MLATAAEPASSQALIFVSLTTNEATPFVEPETVKDAQTAFDELDTASTVSDAFKMLMLVEPVPTNTSLKKAIDATATELAFSVASTTRSSTQACQCRSTGPKRRTAEFGRTM